jgi:hypothetical protein
MRKTAKVHQQQCEFGVQDKSLCSHPSQDFNRGILPESIAWILLETSVHTEWKISYEKKKQA